MLLEEFFKKILEMKERHVCIYGCGANGRETISFLEKIGIKIEAVCDRNSSLKFKTYEAISLTELLKFDKNIICIITPACNVKKEQDILKEHFTTVVGSEWLWCLKKMNSCIPEKNEEWTWECFAPLNHYESPYVMKDSIEDHDEVDLFNLKDIDLNEKEQVSFMEDLSVFFHSFYEDYRADQKEKRYKLENGMFDEPDAALYYGILRKYCPERIIEIGSGYSTALALDVREKYSMNTKIICIEPYPDRLLRILKDSGEVTLYKEFVQKTDVRIFEELEKGDVLFIDSSHVAKMGGDVLAEYFSILPRITSGVIIHIHDIFYPFTYPGEWLRQGRCYNEAFILRALLMNSREYEILFFNDMMHKLHGEKYRKYCKNLGGSSIWLRKK